ncbi:MAG: hypothetical protein ACRENT_04250 [Thermodesulfobacteriota bacterium]
MSSTLIRDVKMTGVPADHVDRIKSGLERQGYEVTVKKESGTFTVIGTQKSQGK